VLALRLRFPARRFHATPWSRHVNEAEVAWPPDLWRLCRALIATWHRKLAEGGRNGGDLPRLLAALVAAPPVYRLPPAVHAHARHYMPTRSGSSEKPTLVFDAFARVDPDDPLVVAWPALDLDAENAAFLDALLAATGYLGRAESWLDAELSDTWDGEPNCVPVTAAAATGEGRETVDLLQPRTPEDYRAFRSHFLEGLSARGQKIDRKTAATLPESWIEALSVETSDLHAAGWSQPPAARQIRYLRPADSLKPAVLPRPRPRRQPESVTTARFALYRQAASGPGGTGGRAPLPRIEDSVRVGEWFRRAVMSRAKQVFGEHAIPEVFSGHAGLTGHRHAFYLPEDHAEDHDGDGRIDHLVLHAPAGLDGAALRALDRLDYLCNRDGQKWLLILEAVGTAQEIASASKLLGESGTWEPRTPYLHPWHVKKGFSIEDQLRRECRERGLPDLARLERIGAIQVAGRERRPVHYHRFRSKRGLTQPDTQGSFWRLTFRERVRGPLALGFGCHFGLGLFTPAPSPG
jgi:CRISPR-associated protein Csb2